MRAAIVVAAACLSAAGLCAAQDVQASIKKFTNIPAQELVPALKTLAHERGFHVVFLAEVVGNKHTQGAVGDLTTTEALTRLLDGTNLVYSYLGDKTVTILPVNSSNKSDGQGASAGNLPTQIPATGIASAEEARVQNSNGEESTTETGKLQEIVVTAQKKMERLQDVPVPVTAIDTQSLVNSNGLRLQDYYSSVPGLSISSSNAGKSSVSIRGLSSGGGNPTVGITIDDVPYGSSSAYGGDSGVPDLDPSDLARVEVLRGPQGTLYGASSIGGLLKFVTVDPSTDAITGRLQANLNGIHESDDVGYGVRGAINVPLGDTLAVRASGFTRSDAGYIDNVVTGESDVNKVNVHGGHVSALWRPSETLSLKLSALLQKTRSFGSPDIDPTLGGLRQSDVKGTGAHEQSEIYSATLATRLGPVDLTSVTGYNIHKGSVTLDISPLLGGFFYGAENGALLFHDPETRKFSQEVRASIPIGSSLEWLIGGFYGRERSHVDETAYAAEPATGELVGNYWDVFWPSTYTEYAGFTNLTYHFSDRFDLQIGGRQSKNRQTYSETDGGNYGPIFFGVAGPLITSEVVTHDSAFTYLVTPRFKITPDLMLYSRVASGFRSGGPNSTCTLLAVPCHFSPDKTRNYEVGAKGALLDHRVTFDVSAYYIDWKDIQLSLVGQSGAYLANVSRAKSEGVELSTELRPRRGLSIAAWVAWNDAKLTEPFPANSAAVGLDGDRLPYSSRWSGNISLQQEFPLWHTASGFVGGALAYTGDRQGIFLGTPERQNYPSYTRLDLHAGVNYDAWTLSLFANNVANKRGVLEGGMGAITPGFRYIQGRTIGLMLARNF